MRSVADALEPHCSSMNVPETPFVLHLPNVMHLASDVAGVVHDASTVSSLQLAASLHPSAAVGGTPTAEAVRLIGEIEGMDRGRYAGPVGWMDTTGDGEWGIALRSAEVSGRHGAALRRLRDRRRLRPRGRAGRGAGQVRPRPRLADRRLTVPGRVEAVNLAHVIETPVPGRGEHRHTKPTTSASTSGRSTGRCGSSRSGWSATRSSTPPTTAVSTRPSTPTRSRTSSGGPRELGDELTRPITPGSFGENLTVSGIAVNDARPGERWAVGDGGPRGGRPAHPVLDVRGLHGLCRSGSDASPPPSGPAPTCGW